MKKNVEKNADEELHFRDKDGNVITAREWFALHCGNHTFLKYVYNYQKDHEQEVKPPSAITGMLI